MKATGIVRRIDDLGRVVIPKEIRRTMRIREGDPLEIYTDREGEVIFKKYSPIGELASFAAQYAETLHKTCSLPTVICDRDSVIAFSGVPRKEFSEKKISKDLEDVMEGRSLYVRSKTGDAPFLYATDESSSYAVNCAMPILAAGDIVGIVISLIPSDTEAVRGRINSVDESVEIKLIQTAAGFLGRQLES